MSDVNEVKHQLLMAAEMVVNSTVYINAALQDVQEAQQALNMVTTGSNNAAYAQIMAQVEALRSSLDMYPMEALTISTMIGDEVARL